MGNDGGSIPKRRELVKEAARNPTTAQIKETQHEQQEYYWSTDPLSRRPLARPIVSDSNGKLYNKDSILEHLLSASDPDANTAEAELILQGSVKSLKDVVELQLNVSEQEKEEKNETWICPVTSDKLGPGSKAVYLVPCGHVFAGVAIKEVAGDKCVVCDIAFAENDVIPILPTAKEDIARLQLRVKTLKEQGLTHSLKKAGKEKKKKKRDREEDDSQATEKNGNGAKKANGENGHGIKNSSTKALTDKVMQEQERRKKSRMDNDNLKSLFSSRDQGKPTGKSSDFMTRGYEIPAGTKR
ncbi:Rtf2 RING-finger-domain-containing protein [Elsinoe ampelina]|uniref:Rtf2 RING-finger-domain-containing protein n=1 Tax=Elsinoe ampelina TaxID=302913 RepID=A0A6A6GMJ5_9PEZI|nr:Rtf2 RING-finger-domain-containing protein [Elsinoe ampelina]